MRILVTGPTGFVGQRLCEFLQQRGHRVVGLSRGGAEAERRVPSLEKAYGWDPLDGPPPPHTFDGVDGVVHLAGETVVGRWNAAKKAAIRDSRVVGTRYLVEGLSQLESKPKVFVSASAIGYYGDRGDEELTEDSAPGDDFLATTCQAWEREARKADGLGVATARLRIGIVLGSGGGALDAMLTPFKLGAGGPLGSGRQWWSWIHRDDLVELILFLLENPGQGAINATAPEPVRQKEFARILGRVLSRPAFMPAPAFALKTVLGGFASELLSSKRVLPKAAQGGGFQFAYPSLEESLRNILLK